MFVQVEETTREREERLKGWSTFLEEDTKGKQTNTTTPAEGATATEPTNPSSTTKSEQHPESEPRPSKQKEQEEEVNSTDSSLAGSEDEEA